MTCVQKHTVNEIRMVLQILVMKEDGNKVVVRGSH